MSNTIDQRVVEMQFDNRNFERNVSTTMSTLDKLKQSLKLGGASKGFEDIGAAAGKVNMSGLGSAVETVQAKFSALSVVGITALANITNSAINTGKQLIKSLSIDQITAGWDKFGSKTTSVATLVAQGNAIDDVNNQLDRLNWFTDETSYNFTDMVANIAKFTASGKGLEESVTAMEGIANWAAVSGQNAQTASHAMYQLSQAMGSGIMRKEDYKSIQNASMDTDEFRQKCLDAGVALGTLQKNADGTYKSLMANVKDGDFTKSQFAEHLTQDMWLTSDVMMKVFTDYSSAVSAIYDVTEEKGMLASEVLDEIHTRADELKTSTMTDEEAINAAIKDLGYTAKDGTLLFDAFGVKAFEAAQKARTWGDAVDSVKDAVSTGWMNTFEIIFGNAEEATKLWTDLANAMYDVFAGGGEARNEMLKGWKELGGRDDLIEGFWNVWEGFFGDGDKYLGILGSIKKAFHDIFPPMTSERLANITEGFKNLTEKLKPSAETLDKVKRAFKGLFSIFDIGKKVISAILKPVGQLLGSEGFGSLGDFLLNTAANIGDFFTELNEGFETTKISDVLSKITSGISNFLKGAVDGLGGLSGIFSSVGNTICKVASKIWGAVTKVFGWIKENISAGDIFAGLAGGGIFAAAKKFSGLVDKIKDIFSNMFDKKEKTDGIKAKITDILNSVHDSLESFTSGIKVASLVGIAAAVTLLSSAFKKISELDGAGIAKSLLAIGVSLAMMVTALNLMPKNKAFATDFFGMSESTNLIKSGAAMVLMAASIKILADAITKLSELSLKEIGKGLIAVGGGMTILSLGLKALNDVKVPLRTSIAMLALAESCKILGDAFTKFSGFSWSEIARGLVAMGGALGELVAAMAILEKFGGFSDIFGSLGILITVKSLGELAESLQSFGTMQWDEIGRGLTAMGGALAELTIVLAALSKISTISLGGSASGGIIGVFSNKLFGKGGASVNGSGSFSAQISGLSNIFSAGAIWVVIQGLSKLADSLSSFGSMSWSEIARGLAGMGGALAEVGAVTGVLGKLAGFSSIIGSGSILLAVQGLADLVDAFKQFGGMSWDEIGRGLAGMGGALAEVGAVTGALGKIAGFSSIIGSGAILLTIQGLADLADAFKQFGGMSWGEIARGLAGMGGALAEVGAVTGALGYLTGFAGILGAGTIWIAVQGLDDLANALKKFGEMDWGEIGRGLAAMGGALSELAVGSLLNTLSGLGALSIKTIAGPLGTLADSMKKWSGVTIPLGLGFQLTALAGGVQAFTFGGLGALTILGISESLGVLADSVRNWSGVTIPEGLNDNLASLAEGVRSFTFDGLGAAAISAVADPLGILADSVSKWSDVTVPSNLGTNLEELASGVRAFSFAFLGGWSIDAVAEPLKTLAGSVRAWKNVSVPDKIDDQLKDLADAVKVFSWAFLGGWSIGAVTGPLEELAKSVKAWDGVSVPNGLGDDLEDLAKGTKAFNANGNTSSAMVRAAEGLAALVDPVNSWSGVTVPDGIDTQLEDLAKGIKSFTFDGLGAAAISDVADPLGVLADSVRNWTGVSIPDGLAKQFTELAKGIREFTFDGLGSSSVDIVAEPLGVMADSVSKWSDITIPDGLGDKLKTIAKGIGEFTFKGFASNALTDVAEPLGVLADSASKWEGITIPDNLGDQLKSLATGAKEFGSNKSGMSAIGEASDGLDSLADSIAKWKEVTVPETLPGQLTTLAEGVKAFCSDELGESILGTTAGPLGTLADSMKKWSGVTVPDELSGQLENLAKGIKAFSSEELGTDLLSSSAAPLGVLAESVSKWSGVIVPEGLTGQLEALATGVKAFCSDELGDNILGTTVGPLGDLADSIKKWSGVTVPDGLSGQLSTLAEGVKAFIFDDAGEGANALVTAAPGIGAMADNVAKWANVTVPETLPGQLSTLAEGIKAFCFGDLGDNSLGSVAPGVGDMADSIAKWANVTVPETLPGQLSTLAEGIKAFCFSDLGESSLATSATGVGLMADSIVKWAKVTVPETLPAQLATLAAGVKAFCFGNLGESSLTTSATGVGNMADAIKNWKGVTIPEGLSGQLKNLADGIRKFEGITSAPSGAAALEKIGTAATTLSGINFGSITSGLDSLATSLTNFGTQATSISGVGEAIVNNIVVPIQNAGPLLSSAGETMANSLAVGIGIGASKVATSATKVAADAASKIKTKKSDFRNVGRDLTSSYAEGLTIGKSTASSNAVSMATATKNSIRGLYNGFKEAGWYLVEGFATGITLRTWVAKQAAKTMAEEAMKAAKEKLDVNSPSKEFKKIGAAVPEGFAMGIATMSEDVDKSVVTMASSAIESAQKAMASIASSLSSDIDAQPVIRPVVDLSDVQTGAAAVSGMFDTIPMVGIRSDLNAINASMNNKPQNGTNNDIVSAINKLGAGLENSRGDTYNFGDFTYDDGSNVADAVGTLIRYAKIGRRV